MQIFTIFLIIGIIMFLGAFKFKKADIIFLIFSSLIFILLGVQLISNDIQIQTSENLIYEYNYSYNPPLLEKISNEPVFYTSGFERLISYSLILLGCYIFFMCMFEINQRKDGKSGN